MAAALKHKIQQRGNGANKMQSGYNRKYVLFFCVVEVKNNVSHIICFKFAKQKSWDGRKWGKKKYGLASVICM